jgi:hypothetical protein
LMMLSRLRKILAQCVEKKMEALQHGIS